MKREDIQKVLFILQNAYPNTYRKMTAEEMTQQIEFYLDMLGEYETPIVVAALKNYIKKNQYPPTIAGLTEQIELLLVKDTDQDKWNLVVKACKNGSYGSIEEFNKLPLDCQRWVGSADNLKQLSQLDPNTFNTVTKGQFLKTIHEIQEKTAVREKLPQNIKDLLDGGLKQLPDLEDKHGRD